MSIPKDMLRVSSGPMVLAESLCGTIRVVKNTEWDTPFVIEERFENAMGEDVWLCVRYPNQEKHKEFFAGVRLMFEELLAAKILIQNGTRKQVH